MDNLVDYREQVKGKVINEAYIMVGCDPELFFERKGRIVGAEKVIGQGLNYYQYERPYYSAEELRKKHLVLDGVQAEINVDAEACRANVGNRISKVFKTLRTHLKDLPDIQVSFRGTVEVSQDELDTLSPACRVLGCMPSKNIYDHDKGLGVDPATYLKRSAGGHIHLGLDSYVQYNSLLENREYLVPILDILVGNTCVMIDRDPGAAERRKVYGRAGEYRTPKHGLEYRTLSNFWLRSYQLFSFVTGMCRVAAGVLNSEIVKINPPSEYQRNDPWEMKQYEAWVRQTERDKWPAASYLKSLVDPKLIQKAINENDYELARANFEPVRQFLADHNLCTGLTKGNMDQFLYFIDMIQEKGIEHWFPQNPVDHWADMPEGHGTGWESWIEQVRVPTSVVVEKKVVNL